MKRKFVFVLFASLLAACGEPAETGATLTCASEDPFPYQVLYRAPDVDTDIDKGTIQITLTMPDSSKEMQEQYLDTISKSLHVSRDDMKSSVEDKKLTIRMTLDAQGLFESGFLPSSTMTLLQANSYASQGGMACEAIVDPNAEKESDD